MRPAGLIEQKRNGGEHDPEELAELVLAYARGTDRINPTTGAAIADTDEFDLDVTYDVPRVKGLQLRLRNAYVEAGGERTGVQFRFIVNWEIDLLWRRQGVAVEVDGYASHSAPLAFHRDRVKTAELQASGLHVIRLTWQQVVADAPATLVLIARALVRPEAPPGHDAAP